MTRYFFLFILTLTPDLILADTWAEPKITFYFSQDSTYMLKVFPRHIPEKYYKWKSSKPRKLKNFTEQDTTIIPCYAILFKIESSDTLEVWKRSLINYYMPVYAIVSNDGKSIATFDNWFTSGYGQEAMVTYDEIGNLTNRFKLEDFSPFPISDYLISISSIWWRCGAKYIDEQTIEICFQDKNENTKTRLYNLVIRDFV
jgi:hypothetical protein